MSVAADVCCVFKEGSDAVAVPVVIVMFSDSSISCVIHRVSGFDKAFSGDIMAVLVLSLGCNLPRSGPTTFQQWHGPLKWLSVRALRFYVLFIPPTNRATPRPP